jgi:predicted NBD/HSP70 family sugar kinase
MADTPENPGLTALRNAGKQKLGDALFEKAVTSATKACQQAGISDAVLLDTATRRGFEAIEAVAVDQWLADASAGDKQAQQSYDEWYKHSFPNSRKARWARGDADY